MRQTFRTYPSANLVFLVPALGVVYVTLLPVLWWKLGAWVALPAVIYLTLTLAIGVSIGLKYRTVAGSAVLPILYGLIHMCYGCGLIYEAIVQGASLGRTLIPAGHAGQSRDCPE